VLLLLLLLLLQKQVCLSVDAVVAWGLKLFVRSSAMGSRLWPVQYCWLALLVPGNCWCCCCQLLLLQLLL
jgi:hypothetical protein